MRMRDSAIGVAILVAWLGAGPVLIIRLLGDPLSLWLSISGFLLGPTLFLIFYPLWAAGRCGSKTLLKWPGLRPAIREAIIGFGCGVALTLGLGGIEFALFGKTLDFPEPLRQLIVAPDALMLIVVCVLALTFIPLGEELFYRGLVYGSLRRWGVPAALALQALVFALVHQYGLIYSVFVFAGGVLFGIVYEWRRTLWAPVFMHLTTNIVTVTLLVMAFIAYGNSPLLGVVLENHDNGCRIKRVLPNSSAEEAGLKAGDIVISLDDQPTSRPDELISTIEQFELGSELWLEINRGGSNLNLPVTLNHTRR